jgi:hypothetical protein
MGFNCEAASWAKPLQSEEEWMGRMPDKHKPRIHRRESPDRARHDADRLLARTEMGEFEPQQSI